jgi:hypothetical protein
MRSASDQIAVAIAADDDPSEAGKVSKVPARASSATSRELEASRSSVPGSIHPITRSTS